MLIYSNCVDFTFQRWTHPNKGLFRSVDCSQGGWGNGTENLEKSEMLAPVCQDCVPFHLPLEQDAIMC